jgi:hypothetical protein
MERQTQHQSLRPHLALTGLQTLAPYGCLRPILQPMQCSTRLRLQSLWINAYIGPTAMWIRRSRRSTCALQQQELRFRRQIDLVPELEAQRVTIIVSLLKFNKLLVIFNINSMKNLIDILHLDEGYTTLHYSNFRKCIS